ncbi:MAG: Ig-like domain-containing protein, partial [Candidatus Margulisbacteria bacterium]|nr:Ig-like domain-containing protein [Candidatus Margulisiibacteriota bacterium]
VNGVQRGINLTGDSSQFFLNANAANYIQSLDQNGFQLGSASDVNAAGTTYRYVAWLGVPTKVGFEVQPTNTAAGASISPEVVAAIQDQFGNPISYDSSSQITLSILTNPGSSTLSGTLTRTVSGGVATFEGISLNKSGNGYVLQAASAGYTSGSSESFNITPASGTTVSFVTHPTTSYINTVLSPSIEVAVKDSLGNIITSDNSTLVSIAVGAGPAGITLSGTLTKTASAGRVFFDDLSMNWRSTGYTLVASAPYITSATSNSFDITAESVAPTIIYYSPTNESAGVSPEAKVHVGFSEAMDQTAVQNDFTCKAIRNNLGTTIDSSVAGSFVWTTIASVEFTPTTDWEYNYIYLVTVSADARDTVGNSVANPTTFQFTTIATRSAINTTIGDDGVTQISIPSGAIEVAFYVRVNISPEVDPIFVSPDDISAATAKVAADGDDFSFVLDGSIREFAVLDEAGQIIHPAFKTEATIVLPYTDNNNDGYVDGVSPPVRGADLRICRLDEDNGLWVLYPDSTVDTVAKTVSAKVKSLSTFGVMAQAASTLSDVYTYPSPFKAAEGHTTITFANLASTCTIKIFTITGRLVRTLSETNGDRQHIWDVTNSGGEAVVSGLYIYLVESADDKKTGKLVIIR